MPAISSPSPASSNSGTTSGSLPMNQSSVASTSTSTSTNSRSRSEDSMNETKPGSAYESVNLRESTKPVLLGKPIIRSSVYTPNAPQLSNSVDRMSLPIVSDTESTHGVSHDDYTMFKRLPKRQRCCCCYTSPTVRSTILVLCTLFALSIGVILFFVWPRVPAVTLKSLSPLTERNYYSHSNHSINYFMEANFEIENKNYFAYAVKTLSVESFALNQASGALFKSAMDNVQLGKRSGANDTLKVIFDFSYAGKPIGYTQSLVSFYQHCYKDQSVRLIFNVNFDYQWTSWTGRLFTSTLQTMASCPMSSFASVITKQFPQLVA